MSKDYTTNGNGEIAVPSPGSLFNRAEPLPVIMGAGTVRQYAREIADSIISDARTEPGPVVWVTGNAYMPPMRSFNAAERVWQAENSADGELWPLLVEMVEDMLARENVALECPEWDNSLYAVDLRRWQYREEPAGDDINGEWEPVDPDAVDDNAENPRE